MSNENMKLTNNLDDSMESILLLRITSNIYNPLTALTGNIPILIPSQQLNYLSLFSIPFSARH